MFAICAVWFLVVDAVLTVANQCLRFLFLHFSSIKNHKMFFYETQENRIRFECSYR